DNRVRARVIGKRNAGADADFQNAPADALRSLDRSFSATLEHLAEDEIVDRRPARVRLFDRVPIERVGHSPLWRDQTCAATLSRGAATAACAARMNPPPSMRASPCAPS